MNRRSRDFLWVIFLSLPYGIQAEININKMVPAVNGTVIKEGETAFLSCMTDKKWFFCVWKSPFGDKQCAIQENGATNVCKGDQRIHLHAGPNNCDLRIYNVSSSDTGRWMCLVHDGLNFDTDKAYLDIEVGMQARIAFKVGMEVKRNGSILRVLEGTKKDITCEASEANPAAQFRWSGPRIQDATTGNDSRHTVMSKYIGGKDGGERNWRGNITIKEKALHNHNEVGHYTNSNETITYHANSNDTNKTITCFITQSDKFGNAIYHMQQSITIIVDKIAVAVPAPTTLSLPQQIGIIAGILLAIIFLILICVCLTIIACRRQKRSPASSLHITLEEDKSDHEIHPVWTTSSHPEHRQHLFGQNNEAYPKSYHELTDDSDSVLNSERSSGTENSPSGQRQRSTTQNTKTITDSSSSNSIETDQYMGQTHVLLHPNLRTAPSLHETHFGVSQNDLPLTILHPPNISLHLPGKRERTAYNILDPAMRKISSSHSDVIPKGLSIFQPIQSRPASSMALFANENRVPQRLSTPTCAGSKSSFSHSVFDCDLGCFMEKYKNSIEGAGDDSGNRMTTTSHHHHLHI